MLSKTLSVSVTPDELAIIRRSAGAMGMSMSEWVRQTVMDAATHVAPFPYAPSPIEAIESYLATLTKGATITASEVVENSGIPRSGRALWMARSALRRAGWQCTHPRNPDHPNVRIEEWWL